eukprot:TRINITY_DN10486_c0_g2_i1.p1 TRINITY_DN10486_c0_g2~~TRINITY_DN10486_c0_g2_i1.p1  ORF type:complete len:153 (+),score=60.27 TRINITY_DN10486_c0_g2_i1:60-461(+)
MAGKRKAADEGGASPAKKAKKGSDKSEAKEGSARKKGKPNLGRMAYIKSLSGGELVAMVNKHFKPKDPITEAQLTDKYVQAVATRQWEYLSRAEKAEFATLQEKQEKEAKAKAKEKEEAKDTDEDGSEDSASQ